MQSPKKLTICRRTALYRVIAWHYPFVALVKQCRSHCKPNGVAAPCIFSNAAFLSTHALHVAVTLFSKSNALFQRSNICPNLYSRHQKFMDHGKWEKAEHFCSLCIRAGIQIYSLYYWKQYMWTSYCCVVLLAAVTNCLKILRFLRPCCPWTFDVGFLHTAIHGSRGL